MPLLGYYREKPLLSHDRHRDRLSTIPPEGVGVSDGASPVRTKALRIRHRPMTRAAAKATSPAEASPAALLSDLTVREGFAPLSIDVPSSAPHDGDVLSSSSLAATFGRISVVSEADTSVLRLVGEIDDVAIAAFEETATASGSSRAPRPMISIVDLAQVTYFSSAGVSFLLRSTREARNKGCRPALRGLDNPARRVLHLTGVTELFDAEV